MSECKHEERYARHEYHGSELHKATAYCRECENTWVYRNGNWEMIEKKLKHHYCNYCRDNTFTVDTTDCEKCGLSKTNENLTRPSSTNRGEESK